MCIMNTTDKEVSIDINRYKERINEFTQGVDVSTGISVPLSGLKLGGNYLLVLDLKN